tara:strand:- start:11686 stop:12627 length:942 start_codon:yes stop_codon:yes gene_type:complete
MSKDLKKIFFSPEIASSLGLEEAIILSLIESFKLNEESLFKKLNFLSQEKIKNALSKLLVLELIEKLNSEFVLKNSIRANLKKENNDNDLKLKVHNDVLTQAKSLGMTEEFIQFHSSLFKASNKNLESDFKTNFQLLKYLIRAWRQEEKKEKTEAEKVLIEKDWTPSEDVISILESADMESDFIKKCIPEFIVYWTEKQFKSNEWNSIFINHVRRQWARYKNIIEDNVSPKKMTHDWMPNQNCLDVIKLARIDEKFAKDQIPEFKIYWLDSNQVMTSWNSKFIQHVKYRWFKNNSKSSGIISRLTDKEWAVEY